MIRDNHACEAPISALRLPPGAHTNTLCGRAMSPCGSAPEFEYFAGCVKKAKLAHQKPGHVHLKLKLTVAHQQITPFSVFTTCEGYASMLLASWEKTSASSGKEVRLVISLTEHKTNN